MLIAVTNLKGGVAKTATVHNLAAALAERGRRVLMVDADAGASLTAAVGVSDAGGRCLVEVLAGERRPADVIRNVSARVDILPAAPALADVELQLAAARGRETALRRALEPLGAAYSVVLIDTAPALGLMVINALVAADAAICPVQAETTALTGLRLFLRTIDRVRASFNPRLALAGVLMTFYDARLVHHRDCLSALWAAGVPVMPVQIPRSIRVAEAMSAHVPVIEYEPANPASIAYRELGKAVDLWQREQGQKRE